MMKFKDYYGNVVELSFSHMPFSSFPKHVWVICRYKNQWLLTKHKKRGLEFPGGKVEDGEGLEEAAVREVLEETGATISSLAYIGQYKVNRKSEVIIKNIYFAEIEDLQPQGTYFETDGPVLLPQLPAHISSHPEFSFIMKDNVLQESLKVIESSKWVSGTSPSNSTRSAPEGSGTLHQ